MRKLFLIAGAIVCLADVSPANAQYYYYEEDYYVSPRPSGIISGYSRDCDALREIPNFRALDRNADGHVSKMEFMHLGTLDDFIDLDLNGNGVLNRREINAYRRLCD